MMEDRQEMIRTGEEAGRGREIKEREVVAVKEGVE